MLKMVTLAMAALLTVSGATAEDFPTVQYTSGTIKPDHVPQAELDRQLVEFYREWKDVYIKQGCGDGRYLVNVAGDGKPVGGGTEKGTLTVSEAHGYGMMLMAMMAPVDPEAHTIFDGMVQYFHDHPARSDAGLMAWNQVTSCKDAADVGGYNSATDGDLDIGYALLLADKVWGSAGAINYRAEAQKVLDAVLDKEVAADGDYLLIGDWANTGDDGAYAGTTRSSDFMVSHLKAFAEASGNARWSTVRDRTYSIMQTIREEESADTGLMPDFIVGLPDEPEPAEAGFLEGEHDGMYSWNAARYPWRIGLDYLLNGESRARAALTPFNAWARKTTKGVPSKFADTYDLDGTPPAGHGSNQMAYVSMLGVSAMIDPENQAWLNAVWDATTRKPLANEDYYGNTLKLLAMVTMSGHWLSP